MSGWSAGGRRTGRRTSRRSFLLALAAVSGLPAAGCGLRVGSRHAEALAALVAAEPAAIAVGRVYLAGRGAVTPVQLAREIHDGLGPGARFDAPAELARRVGERIAEEVEAGRFESVAGWSVPATEARLAALAALAGARGEARSDPASSN